MSRRHSVLTVKECMNAIEPFYGNTNKKADVVDAAELITFNAWFDAAQWKLDAACLSAREQVAVLCQRLQGPIHTAYMIKSRQSHEVFTVSEMKSQLQSLFAESAVQFTDKALDMKFSSWSLVADIQKFKTYVLNSSLGSTADHNEFLYSKLRSKMNAVRANILMHAASEFPLQLDPNAGFDEYVQQAIQSAHRVQANSVSPKRGASPPLPKQPPSKRPKGEDKSKNKDIKKTSSLYQRRGCPPGWAPRLGGHPQGGHPAKLLSVIYFE